MKTNKKLSEINNTLKTHRNVENEVLMQSKQNPSLNKASINDRIESV